MGDRGIILIVTGVSGSGLNRAEFSGGYFC